MKRRMQRKQREPKGMQILKALLLSYIVTVIMLVLLTVLLYKMELGEKTVSAGIVGTYVLSTMIGGIFLGRKKKERRFLWGIVLGILYFLLLITITLGVYHTLNGSGINLITTLILCAGGGMTGGMIS